MREILLVCLSVLLATGQPQEKPDFSGQWVLDSERVPPSDVPRELTVVQTTEQRTAVRGDPIDFTFLSIQRHYANEVRTDTYDIGITGGIVNADGSSRTYSVKWIGTTLSIGVGTYSGPPPGRRFNEHLEQWSLDADGRLRVVAEDRAPGRNASITSIYKRRR